MDLSFQAVLADAYKIPFSASGCSASTGLEAASIAQTAGMPISPRCEQHPVADFFCTACNEDYELKSQRKQFGAKVVDGAYPAMIRRLSGNTNPNLLLLNYNFATLAVTNLVVIPKHFFTTDIIEERKPLPPTARRAGWVGCRILLQGIPHAGRIPLIQNGTIKPKTEVLSQWQRTLFLRKQRDMNAKGWLLHVMQCIERIGKGSSPSRKCTGSNKNCRPHTQIIGIFELKFVKGSGVAHNGSEFLGRGEYRISDITD